MILVNLYYSIFLIALSNSNAKEKLKEIRAHKCRSYSQVK
jgi:hypothetical protein